jgi:acyl-coenzyme A thioesterase PaaI-like protein
MTHSNISIGDKVIRRWQRLAGIPLGRWLFSKMIARTVPYSGSINPRVLELRPGYARVGLVDRKRIRNHLDCVHAIALANFGELASGMAVLTAMPHNVRGIVTNISIDYMKKARGYLVAEGKAELPDITTDTTHRVFAEIKDTQGDVVATVNVLWQLGVVNK